MLQRSSCSLPARSCRLRPPAAAAAAPRHRPRALVSAAKLARPSAAASTDDKHPQCRRHDPTASILPQPQHPTPQLQSLNAITFTEHELARSLPASQAMENEGNGSGPLGALAAAAAAAADAGGYAAPDEMSLWEDEPGGSVRHYSSHRQLQLAYQPPQSDLPGAAVAVGLIAAWAAVFRHGVFEYNLAAPLSLAHVLDGLATFASLEFLSTGLFITTHDSMHGAVTPNNRFLNDVLGAVCVSLYAWFDFSSMWTKHWDHHNMCGTPREDPDFHKGDPALLPWFLNFMKGYITWQQFAKLQATVLFFAWKGAAMPNMVVFWLGSGALSALRLFYFGTYLPHRPRYGAGEVMAWAKARSAKAPALLSFLRCYCFDMHWEHHRWPKAPWWDLPRARSVRYDAVGSIDD